MKNNIPPALVTLSENSRQVGSSAYWGEHGQSYIAIAIHRDSDALTRSNWRVMHKQLSGIDPETLHIERFSHWAVGWVDYLLIRPDAAAVIAKCQEFRASLEDYPVLDEEDWSNEEQQEADETWRNCYDASERIEYIRKHRSQFEFRSLGDALGCVRGNYFAGYAGELIA